MKTTSKKLPIIIGIIIIAVIAIVGIILVIGNGGHRVIKVDKVSGEVSLEREETKQEIYEGINLKSKDAVITGQDGQVELLVDSDKHIWAQENTKFKVVSTGDENKGKLKIELQYGTSLVEIEEKLPEGAFFEVETPNATVGVRGTSFETSYYKEENKTVVVVTSGVVEVISDTESAMVEAGQSAVVVEDNIEVVASDIGESNAYTFINDPNVEDTYYVEEIIYRTEIQKNADKSILSDEDISALKKVPNSIVTYVAVDGLGNAVGMGPHFQGSDVGVRANPISGYHYVGCESETIDFYQYIPDESLGYDIPVFHVPDSGEHIIYVYYALNE